MTRTSWPVRFMAVMMVVPAFACADNDDTDVEINTETPQPPAMAPVTVTIMPQGGSMLAGE